MIALKEAYNAGLFKSEHLGKNISAGIVVGIVAMPLAMAFAIASGVSPAQGIYTAIISAFFVSILACPAILFARTRAYFLTYCPDMDSLYCQHPSCLFTDIDRCISISVHLISTRAAVYSFG